MDLKDVRNYWNLRVRPAATVAFGKDLIASV